MSNKALQLWQERLDQLEQELAIASNAAQRFELTKQIEQCQQKIQQLEAPPRPEEPLSQDQPKANDKRKWSVTIKVGLVSTLALAGVSIGMLWNRTSPPEVPPCSLTEECLFKIFPQVSNGNEEIWSYSEDKSSNPNYKPPTYKYVSNDRDCGGSPSSPVLKLQYEFPDKKQGYSTGWRVSWDDGFDVSKFSTLKFEIKSASGSGKFGVGLKDIKEGKSAKDYQKVASSKWKKISIPLSQIDNNVEKSKITKIYIAFLSQDGSGTICIDNIQLH